MDTQSPIFICESDKWESLLVSVIEGMAHYLQDMGAGYIRESNDRVVELSELIARRLGCSDTEVRAVRLGALLHDIGNIGVPASVLNQQGALTNEDFAMVKEHVKVGYDIVRASPVAWPLAEMIYQHHERLDGSGYPLGIGGRQIGLGARILAVADVVSSMTSDRPYREAVDARTALGELALHSGSLYDPAVVEACTGLFNESAVNW